jgi:predicted DNA-binding transcriptional regulator YafY
MPYQNQNTSTLRQFQIIKRLYTMETLHGKYLAEELAVSQRTILRDMKKISSIIPLLRDNGSWSLNLDMLTKMNTPLTHTLLSAFAQNVDIDVVCFEKSNLSEDKVSFAIEYKNLPKKLGELIVEALQKELQCTFIYVKTDTKTIRTIDPIKFYTEKGRWYLVARDYKDDKVKMFLLSKIKDFKLTTSSTTLNTLMLKEAENIKSVWSTNSNATDVKLYIKPSVAEYFYDMKIHKTQKIIDRHYDGGMEVECAITHKLEILPAIKSWLPNIHILEPKWLWEELMRDLEYYKDEDWKMDT